MQASIELGPEDVKCHHFSGCYVQTYVHRYCVKNVTLLEKVSLLGVSKRPQHSVWECLAVKTPNAFQAYFSSTADRQSLPDLERLPNHFVRL